MFHRYKKVYKDPQKRRFHMSENNHIVSLRQIKLFSDNLFAYRSFVYLRYSVKSSYSIKSLNWDKGNFSNDYFPVMDNKHLIVSFSFSFSLFLSFPLFIIQIRLCPLYPMRTGIMALASRLLACTTRTRSFAVTRPRCNAGIQRSGGIYPPIRVLRNHVSYTSAAAATWSWSWS